MSTDDTQTQSQPGSDKRPEAYTQGPDRYINFIEKFFDVTPSTIQRRLLRAVAENQRVIAVGGNGPGKSYIAALLNGAFLYSNTDSICMPTSGTYGVLNDTLWKPLQARVKRAKEEHGLPGRCLQSPPRIEIDDEWYLKAVSPTHPSNLEGRHAGTMLITIEEADKPDITMEHIDSAESMMTSDQDRMLCIANPPEDEGNCVYDLMQDDSWETIRFSSFDSHNVRVEMGREEGEIIPAMVDLDTIKHDWERWNKEPWPGAEAAERAHEERKDLDTRWYRRRAGVMPPAGAEAHRPFYVSEVREAVDREPRLGEDPVTIGIDVARQGGDEMVVSVLYPTCVEHHVWRGKTHPESFKSITAILEQTPGLPPVGVDAIGEGSPVADNVIEYYDGEAYRFKAGEKAMLEDEYYNCWTEGLVALGDHLEDGLAIRDDDLREELFAVARAIELEENHRRSGDVLRATSKSVLKERLNRSPDRLDATLVAAWVAHVEAMGPSVSRPRITRSF